MKIIFSIRTCIILLLSFSIFSVTNAQLPVDPDGETCPTANPFCSDVAYYFPNSSGGVTTAPVGPNYGCLYSTPNPIWYYMKIGTSGTIELTVSQTDLAGFGIDIDFALWGPFTDLATGCTQILSGTLPPLQCSYSSAAIETIGLGMPGGAGTGASTPPAAVAGEYYIVILTNYENEPGNISFEQTGGTGSTDCSIITCGLTLSSNGPICQGSVLQLEADDANDGSPGIAITYNWSGPGGFTSTVKNPSLIMNTPGVHQFKCKTIITFDGETDSCEAYIDVVVYPTYRFVENKEVCAGQVFTYHGEVFTRTGVYEIKYRAVDGCDSIYVLNFTVNPMPNVDLNTPNSIVYICEGEEAILGVQEPLNTNSYQWLYNGATLPGATQSSYAATTPGTYRLTAITDKGCADTSRAIQVIVQPAASVQIRPLEVDASTLCIGDTINVGVYEQPNYEYRWSPEKFMRQLSGYRLPHIQAKIYEPAYITVWAMNEYGCQASDSIWVGPIPCCDVLLPTAFSPNGDGLNDNFNILLQSEQQVVTFQIFDKYGGIVYDNNTPKSGWNGYYPNGEPAMQGVYYYRIIYTCTDKKNYEKKGDVTLVR